MKYQAYPEYKDSCVEWVGKIPVGWDTNRFKYRVSIITDKANSKTNPVGLENIDSWTGGFISSDSVFQGEGVVFQHGDLLFGKLRPYLAKVYLANTGGEAVGDFHVFRPKNIVARYLQYLMLTEEYISIVDSSTYGAKMPRASWKFMSDMGIPCPSLGEQQTIANFLDHETAKIDTLIAKQQQLIKLLKEKRQAVISHAVTKGLNPDAPMKDSGVEWLGEVPEHWKVKPLKHLCRFSGGGTPSKDNLAYWENGDIPWVSPKDMRTFWLADTQDKLTVAAVEESSTNYVEPGALLMVVRSGILQRKIPVAVNTVQVTLNQDMKALRFNSEMAVSFAANFVLGYQDPLLLEWAKQGATVESIEHEYLANSYIPVPPHHEQIEINQFIEKKMNVFNSLEEKTIAGIELLKERRACLISAAVTGKIDIRNWKVERGFYEKQYTP